jgi:uncharacterized repeat protein (TIGR01451 family)
MVSGGLDTVFFEIGTLQPFERKTIHLTYYTPDTTTLGSIQMATFGLLQAGQPFEDYQSQGYMASFVVGSYDPNDKLVHPAGGYSPEMMADSIALDYTIRFQNTGTFYAEKVSILDTLDASLDLNSFVMGVSSHPCEVFLRNTNVLEFLFEDILLPDSTTDFEGSKGYCTYSINPKQDIPLNTEIKNTAYIYFDFNQPIVTNTTYTFYGIPLATQQPTQTVQLSISPNPSNSFAKINWQALDISQTSELVLFDMTGSKIWISTIDTSQGELTIDTKALPNGIYQLSLRTGGKPMQAWPLLVQR